MIKRRLLLLVLITFLLGGLLWAPGPDARATDYGIYDNLLLSTFSEHIIALWPLNELSGAVAYDISGHSYNGSYNGVTLDSIDAPGASMGRAGLWDGINDYVDIFSAGLAGAVSLDEGSILLWFKSLDHTTYRVAADLYGNATHFIRSQNGAASNKWRCSRQVDVAAQNAEADFSSTDWSSLAVTWSAANNKIYLYINGVNLANNTAPTGVLTITQAYIGKYEGAGYLAHGYFSNVMGVYTAKMDISYLRSIN